LNSLTRGREGCKGTAGSPSSRVVADIGKSQNPPLMTLITLITLMGSVYREDQGFEPSLLRFLAIPAICLMARFSSMNRFFFSVISGKVLLG
jgi:hypothetical protein